MKVSLLLACTNSLFASDNYKFSSMNLCTDRLLLQVSAPANIESLTKVARDIYSNNIDISQEQFKHIHFNSGSLEALLATTGSVIFASEYDNIQKIEKLEKYGKTIKRIPDAKNLQNVISNILLMGKETYRLDRASVLVNQINTLMEKILRQTLPTNQSRILILSASGYSSSSESLLGDILKQAGYKNVMDEIIQKSQGKLNQWSKLSLELVIDSKPDIILYSHYNNAYSSSQNFKNHPVLSKVMKNKSTLMVNTKNLICGDGGIIEFLEQLYLFRKGHHNA